MTEFFNLQPGERYQPTLAQRLARPPDAPESVLSTFMSRPQMLLTPQATDPAAPSATSRSDNIGANFLADFNDLIDGYKAIGSALADHGPGILVDIVKNMPAAIAQSYWRWWNAAKTGDFAAEVQRHPLEFIQDVAAPLSLVFSGGGAAAARFGAEAGKVGMILNKAAGAADLLATFSEPISGLAFVGAKRGLGAIWSRALARPPAPPRAGIDPMFDAARAAEAPKPDFPVLEAMSDQTLKDIGITPQRKDALERAVFGTGGARSELTGPQLPRVANAGEQRQLVERLAEELKGENAPLLRTPADRRRARAEVLGWPERAITDRVMGRKPGQSLEQEVIAASGIVLRDNVDKLLAAAKEVLANPDPVLQARVLVETDKVGTFLAQLAGGPSESGAQLRAWEEILQSKAGAVASAIQKAGGREMALDLARIIVNTADQYDTAAVANAAHKAFGTGKWGQRVIGYAINWGMLSGLRTHTTNLMTTSMALTWSIPEEVGASAFRVGARVAKGQPLQVATEAAGIWGRMLGSVEGAKQGVRLFRHGLLTGDTLGGSKLEGFDIAATDLLIGLPGRFLIAEDGITKGIGYMQELYQTAALRGVLDQVREVVEGGRQAGGMTLALGAEQKFNATKALLSGAKAAEAAGDKATAELLRAEAKTLRLEPNAFARNLIDTVKGLPPDVDVAALKSADYFTWTKALREGSLPKDVQDALNRHPVFKLAIPFVRTPYNIVEFAAERTPIAFAFHHARDELLGRNGLQAQSKAWSRMVIGTSVGLTAFSMANDGMLTGGGPVNRNERAALQAQGWQPYSLRLPRFLAGPGFEPGDGWFSFARLEPLGIIMGISADLASMSEYMSQDEYAKTAGLFTLAVTRNLTSKTWLRGLSNLMEVINDPTQYLPTFVGNLFGLAVPNALNQVGEQIDPTFRQVRGILDRVQQRVPGWRESLPARVDLWGREQRSESAGIDLFSPIYFNPAYDDKVSKELNRLKIYPSLPSRDWNGFELSGEQYVDYQLRAGRGAYSRLEQTISSSGWASLPQSVKQQTVWNTLNAARSMARQELMRADPSIRASRQVYDFSKLELGFRER